MKYTVTYNQDGTSTVEPTPFKPVTGDEVTYIYPFGQDFCIKSLRTTWNALRDNSSYGHAPYQIEHTQEVTEITKIENTGSLPLPNDDE